MVMDCQMLLEKFPLDNQTCKINIGSCEYGFPRNYFIILFMTVDLSLQQIGYISVVVIITSYFPSEFSTYT